MHAGISCPLFLAIVGRVRLRLSARYLIPAFSLNILVTPGYYPLRFTIENKYDKIIYIKTTLRKPHDVIRMYAKDKIEVNVNTTTTEVVKLKAYNYLENTEILPINGQFGIQLTPGSTSVIPLAVPSTDYSK